MKFGQKQIIGIEVETLGKTIQIGSFEAASLILFGLFMPII